MRDGHLNFCKECVGKRVTVHRIKNIDKIRKYDRRRYHIENLTEEQIERRSEISRTWNIKNKKRKNEINRIWRQEKNHAHNITARNLRCEKPTQCSICNRESDSIHGHHPNYDKPFEVIWCCPKCHGKLHRMDEQEVVVN